MVKELRLAQLPYSGPFCDAKLTYDELYDLICDDCFITPSPPDLESEYRDLHIQEMVEAADWSDIAESVLYRNHPWPSSDVMDLCKLALFNFEMHPMLLILLLLLPSLRVFEVSTRLGLENMQALFNLFSCFVGPGGHFSNSSGVFLELEQFRVICDPSRHSAYDVFSSISCLPVFHLPVLQALHLDLAAFDTQDAENWRLAPFLPAPGTLSIRELHICTATSEEYGAMDLIVPCKRLVFFSWQVSGFIPQLLEDEDNDDGVANEDVPHTDEDKNPMTRSHTQQHQFNGVGDVS